MKNTVVTINMQAGEVTSITVESANRMPEYVEQPYVISNPVIEEPVRRKHKKAKRRTRK